MSTKVAPKTSTPERKKSSAPARKPATSPSRTHSAPSTQKNRSAAPAPARKQHDHAHVTEEAGRAHGSNQLVKGLGSSFAAPAKSDGAIDGAKTLRRGDGISGKANDSVKQMQQSLIKAGFGKDLGSSGADGKFGPKTQEAVRKFQEKNLGKNGVDGVVGPKTFEALNKGNAPARPDAAAKPGAAAKPEAAARPDGKKPDPAAAAKPGGKVAPAANPQEHLLGLLDKGTNKNRITSLNPAFAKDFSGMMKELQEKHQFQPRITSGWRPGHGHSNHNTGSAADFTAANRKAISNDQLKMMREVAARHGLKILDERHHGYNSQWSGSHLHVSRTGR